MKKRIDKSSRSPGNQRRYPSVVLRYVAIIKAAQSTGIPLKRNSGNIRKYPPNSKLTLQNNGMKYQRIGKYGSMSVFGVLSDYVMDLITVLAVDAYH